MFIIIGIWPQKHDFSVFGVKFPFFQEGHSLFCFQIDSIFYSRLLLKKGKGLKGEKMAIRPLKHIKNELKHHKYDLIFLSVPRSIYLWPYYIKGSYLEYQKLACWNRIIWFRIQTHFHAGLITKNSWRYLTTI